MKVLLDYGAGIDLQDKDGNSALIRTMKSVSRNALQVLLFLIERGANVDLTNNSGRSALSIGCEKGNTERVRTLLKHGAQINLLDNLGKSPLMYASQGNILIV